MALTWDELLNKNGRFIAGSFIRSTAFFQRSDIDVAEINRSRYSQFLNLQDSRQNCLDAIQTLESFVITHPDQDHKFDDSAFQFMRARNAHVFALGSEIGLGKTAAIPQTASADCDLVDVSFDDLPVPNLETVSLDYFVDVYIEQPNPVRLRLQMLRRLLRLLQRALTAFMRSFQTLNETLQFVVRNAPSLIVAGFHPPDIPPAFTFSFMNQLGALAA